MLLIQNTKAVTIKLTRAELLELITYLGNCFNKGFVGTHDYYRVSKEREYYYRYHLTEFATKIVLKSIKSINTKQISIKVTEAEQRMLSVMFKRVDCSPYMLQLQTRFIKNLQPL